MSLTANQRISFVALGILALDQFTKQIVLNFLDYSEEKVIIPGFFKFVHWGNTGAAWSVLKDNNALLAIISLVALLGLIAFRHQFGTHRPLGQVALGLMLGGIMGNVVDRLHAGRLHVIDFLYFYVNRRGGSELGFPAFNVADSAICIGVGLLFILSWKTEPVPVQAPPASAAGSESQP